MLLVLEVMFLRYSKVIIDETDNLYVHYEIEFLLYWDDCFLKYWGKIIINTLMLKWHWNFEIMEWLAFKISVR